MNTTDNILKTIRDAGVEYVDYRFTDPRGQWQHLTMCADVVDDDALENGVMFDGSSIAGWKAINESDMQLQPDLSTAVLDPISRERQLILICDVLEPGSGQAYGRDPRSTARKAENYLRAVGVGDRAVFGPEAEFFVFDNVRFGIDMNRSFFEFASGEGPYASGDTFERGNKGHRPGIKGGYFPVAPIDSGVSLRGDMVSAMRAMGLKIEKHHHEVAPSQHELGLKFDTLVRCADNLQIYKYCVHNTADAQGKSATFMPKPVAADNGSGMHTHQSIWMNGTPVFAGNGYAGLSETALHYIGGVIRHAKALNAFTNPTTNSYKRLVPGYEAPVLLAYSARNRSAACRVPYGENPSAKRIEVRFPDGTANPYLAFSAMLMAGLDGIVNKIQPGEPMDKNLYDLPAEELVGVPTVSGSLREAMHALEDDRDFLLAGGVFTQDQLDAYAELKWQEIDTFENAPHPVEFQMYYSA